MSPFGEEQVHVYVNGSEDPGGRRGSFMVFLFVFVCLCLRWSCAEILVLVLVGEGFYITC
jgi:hypothetical protein